MKRIRYFDILRIVSTALVIWYHMVIQLAISGIYPQGALDPLYSNANAHAATLAVSVFFMLSGACQMIGKKEDFRIGTFYRKRFLTLLIPFYIAWILYFIFHLFVHPEILTFFRTVPKKRFLYTIFGMDEWISMHGTATFSLHIGEWFLGCLVVLTLLFPLFRWVMFKAKHLFFAAATILFVLCAVNYDALCSRFGISVPWNMSLILKGYEYVLGMYLALVLSGWKPLWKIPAVLLSLLFLFSTAVFPGNAAIKTTLFAAAFFISVSLLEPLLQKEKAASFVRVMAFLAGFSYPLFLAHHAVIYEMTPAAASRLSGPWSAVLLFAGELLIMTAAALVIQFLSKKAVSLLRGIFQKGGKEEA